MDNKRNSIITNCEFKFKCPKKWDDLIITEDPKVRHCQQCDQSVTLCTSQKEFKKLTAKGNCIAIDLVQEVKTTNKKYVIKKIIERRIGLSLPIKEKD